MTDVLITIWLSCTAVAGPLKTVDIPLATVMSSTRSDHSSDDRYPDLPKLLAEMTKDIPVPANCHLTYSATWGPSQRSPRSRRR